MAPMGAKSAAFLGTAVTAATLARRARQRKFAPSEPQTEPPIAPKKGEGIAAGLRIVEMASIVAGPVVSRCLADWGAEVIKIEPPEGDLLRGMPTADKDSKPLPRDYPASFEFYNLGKAGVQVDLSKPSELAWLKDLLASADVFVTNVRVQALKKAGLLYIDLAEECPRLIYAHITGWGSEGIDAERAGVDAGPFWSASGLAGALTGPMTSGHYPLGFGDTVCGMSLLAGVLCALLDRDGEQGSGKGQYVDASLLRAGLWCAAPGILAASDVKKMTLEGETITDYSRKPPMHGNRIAGGEAWWAAPFQCGSNRHDYIWFDAPGDCSEVESQLRQAVSRALHFQVDGVTDLMDLTDEVFRGRVSAALAAQAGPQALALLRKEGVSCVARHVTFAEAGAALFDAKSTDLSRLYELAGCVDELEVTHGIKDLARVPRVPIRFSTIAHGPRAAGFRKGQHTHAVLGRGWTTPSVQCRPKASGFQSAHGHRSTSPLHSFTVVELSVGQDLTAGAACCQLAEHGANVLKLQSSAQLLPSKLVQHYDRLKQIVSPDLDVVSTLHSLLSTADVFVTNMSVSELRALGISIDAIKSSFPSITAVVISPWGLNADADAAAEAAGFGSATGALGALWVASGLSGSFMSVSDSPPPRPTQQLAQLCASAFAFAAIGAALVGRQRGQVGSEIVDVSYLGIGMFLGAYSQVFNRHDETRALAYDGFATSSADARLATPFCVSESSDGQFFMTYDLRPSAANLSRKVARMSLFKLMGAVAQGVGGFVRDANVKKGLTGFVQLRPILRPINGAFVEHFGKLSWADISKGMHEVGVWHNRVAMPYQMAAYTTACTGPAANVSNNETEILVHSPVFLRRQVAAELRVRCPSPADNTKLVSKL